MSGEVSPDHYEIDRATLSVRATKLTARNGCLGDDQLRELARMALDNYVEMRAGVVDPDYLAKRDLALELERRHPDHLSPRYNMVMFSTMPYAEARARAQRQAELIATALADETVDVDALVQALPLLPDLDPLADPDALSIS